MRSRIDCAQAAPYYAKSVTGQVQKCRMRECNIAAPDSARHFFGENAVSEPDRFEAGVFVPDVHRLGLLIQMATGKSAELRIFESDGAGEIWSDCREHRGVCGKRPRSVAQWAWVAGWHFGLQSLSW